MLKKIILLLSIGLISFGLIYFISTYTRLFLNMERAMLDGFFFMREYDVHEENPLVSDQVRLLGYDEDSIAVIGKWPWKRYVHGRFLDNIEKFSPKAVFFDVVFAKDESVPEFVREGLREDAGVLEKVETAFSQMDGVFSEALKKYDNVYLDLQLVEHARPGLPDAYYDRIRFNEEIVKNHSLPVKENESIVTFHSLEPIKSDFIGNAHPAVINVLPDDDGVARSFPLYYTYRMNDGSYRNIFTVVLSLARRFYRVSSEDVILTPQKVTLQSAKAPILDPESHQPLVVLEDFQSLQKLIENPTPPEALKYKRELYNFLYNQLVLGVQTDEKIPLFPVHLLVKDDKSHEIIEGWEVYDAAKMAGSKKILAVYYEKRDVEIKTPVPGFFTINYAGREKRYFIDASDGEPRGVTTIPTESYKEVYQIEDLPRIPALNQEGEIKADYDISSLRKWFLAYCEKKAGEIYEQAENDLGENVLKEDILQEYMNRYPEEGKYFFYAIFFMNADVSMEKFSSLMDLYPEFGKAVGQPVEYFLSEKEMVLSLLDLYRGGFQKYYNKFIFTGATALGLGDIQQTPYGSMTGINAIINSFNTIVTRNPLFMSWDIPRLDFSILLGLSILSCLLYGFFSIRWGSFIAVVILLGTFVTGFLLFKNHNLFLTTVPLVFANLIIFISTVVLKILTERKDKKFLKATFSSYLAPEIIDEMYLNKTMPTLGGETKSITAYFTDIQGFSTFSEKLTADQLVELINDYLSAMTDILIGEKGTLDKYEGDAIIAFFGAPMSLPDHPFRACRVALRMQSTLGELIEKWRVEKIKEDETDRNSTGAGPDEWIPGDKWPLIVHGMKMRIGINTGDIVVGNMGSAMRMNYTMMGDPVNLAARLEEAGKQYGVYVMVSEYTLDCEIIASDGERKTVMDLVETRFLDRITVVGKAKPVRVYELCAMKGELTADERELLDLFGKGMALYLEMAWDDATDCFEKASKLERIPDGKTTPSEVYMERCRTFKESPPVPPGEEWDGVFVLTKK